jgi:hypothetical protein
MDFDLHFQAMSIEVGMLGVMRVFQAPYDLPIYGHLDPGL